MELPVWSLALSSFFCLDARARLLHTLCRGEIGDNHSTTIYTLIAKYPFLKGLRNFSCGHYTGRLYLFKLKLSPITVSRLGNQSLNSKSSSDCAQSGYIATSRVISEWLVPRLPALAWSGRQYVPLCQVIPLRLPVLTRLQDNPLHISLFPPYSDSTIEFSFLLNSCLDIFDIRCKQTSIDQDLGLLHAIDERLAAYGWLTTTGVKLLIIVDLFGQEEASTGKQAGAEINGLRDSDVKPVSFSGA